jgi:hypothetical protein
MVNPQIFHDIPTVAACWDKCNTLPTGHTQYSSYKASNGLLECTCFNAFEGKPTGCGSGNTYVWQYGPNVVVSDTNRRRALRQAARQQALLDSHPYCPVGMEACRVAGDPRAEASYECIYPGSELGTFFVWKGFWFRFMFTRTDLRHRILRWLLVRNDEQR